jgi:CubicO group peptidase (beta-lactamase class C family)
MSIGSFGHGGAFGTHGWVDPAKDLVGVFLIQHAGNTGNAKQVFIAMAGASVLD